MATVKVKRPDGFHCFHCNASVDADVDSCPACGRAFGVPDPPPRRRQRPIGEKIKLATSERKRGYRFAVIVLLAAAVILVVLFRPKRATGLTMPRPATSRAAYRVLETWELPARNLERMSVAVLVEKGLPDDRLRDVLDWVLYETLDEQNRAAGRHLRVIWAYALEDSAAGKTKWRAMAIWADPSLPEAQRPAGIGGDAVRVGTVEYDYTNPVTGKAGGGE